MHIVLLEPEIPGNTGNIARLCAATGFSLHLVKPLGFSVDDKHLKRAGLDYWHLVKVSIHENFDEVWETLGKGASGGFYFCSTKAPRVYSQIRYRDDDVLVFGKETAGIDEKILAAHWENCIRVPMIKDARSLNLSNAVAVVAYEALRQRDFSGLVAGGSGLHRVQEEGC